MKTIVKAVLLTLAISLLLAAPGYAAVTWSGYAQFRAFLANPPEVYAADNFYAWFDSFAIADIDYDGQAELLPAVYEDGLYIVKCVDIVNGRVVFGQDRDIGCEVLSLYRNRETGGAEFISSWNGNDDNLNWTITDIIKDNFQTEQKFAKRVNVTNSKMTFYVDGRKVTKKTYTAAYKKFFAARELVHQYSGDNKTSFYQFYPDGFEGEVWDYSIALAAFDRAANDYQKLIDKGFVPTRVQSEPRPFSVSVTPSTSTIHIGDELWLSASVMPPAADQNVEWKLEKGGSVVELSSNGIVTAKTAGKAVVQAVASNGVYGTCNITVKKRKVTSVALDKTSYQYASDEVLQLNATVSPAGAPLKWKSGNTAVATVDQSGKVTPVGRGKAVITVSSVDNPNKKATCTVTVGTYRALLMYGQGNDDAEQTCFAASAWNMRTMLLRQNYGGQRFTPESITVSSPPTLIAFGNEAGKHFGDTSKFDVSLFYFVGHGLESTDPVHSGSLVLSHSPLGGAVSPAQFAVITDSFEGTKVIILDSCFSGVYIGRSLTAKGLAQAILKAAVDKDNYQVLTSSSGTQTSHYSQDAYFVNQTHFTRALCMAGGYDVVEGKNVKWAAANKDNKVTLLEAWQYTTKFIQSKYAHYKWQNPSFYGDNSFILFQKP